MARRSFLTNRSGSAAAEMAMIMPMLIALMFGAFELGNYFWDDHIVAKAVRDGARFASRQPFPTMPCAGTATNATSIKNLVRFGNVGGTGSPRLASWNNASMVTVTLSCGPASTYSGIYAGASATIPVVTVAADVPYSSLFQRIGFQATSLRLRGRSQSAVTGL